MGRVIVVTSGKGGVGKTTVTCNLGLAIASMGYNTVILDMDVGLNNVDVMMNLEDKIVYDCYDIFKGRCRINEALVQDGVQKKLYVLPSTKSTVKERVGADKFYWLVERLSDFFEYVLIDCPAGIETGFHRAAQAAKEAVVVTTPHVPAIRDADKVVSLLSTYDVKRTFLCVNRVRGDLVSSGEMLSPESVANALRIPLTAVIPESDELGLSGRTDLISKQSKTERAYRLFAKNIVEGTRYVLDCRKGSRGVLGKIKRIFGGES